MPPGKRFHELRHFYASPLIRHSESVKTVQARLRHASAVETLNTYGNQWPDADDRTRDPVAEVLGQLARPARERKESPRKGPRVSDSGTCPHDECGSPQPQLIVFDPIGQRIAHRLLDRRCRSRVGRS